MSANLPTTRVTVTRFEVPFLNVLALMFKVAICAAIAFPLAFGLIVFLLMVGGIDILNLGHR